MDLYVKLIVKKMNKLTVPSEKIAEESLLLPFKEGSYPVKILDITSIDIKFEDKSKLIVSFLQDNKMSADFKDDMYPFFFSDVSFGVNYILEYKYCVKIGEKLMAISEICLDTLDIEEWKELANKLGSFANRIEDQKNVKLLVETDTLPDAFQSSTSFLFTTANNNEKSFLDSYAKLNEYLEKDFFNVRLQEYYDGMLLEMKNFKELSYKISYAKLPIFTKKIETRVTVKLQKLLLENKERIVSLRQKNFQKMNGEFFLYYRNPKNQDILVGNIEFVGFDEATNPLFLRNFEKVSSEYFIEERRCNDLVWEYKMLKDELKAYFQNDLTDEENILLFQGKKHPIEAKMPQEITITEAMSYEEKNAYAFYNYAVENGLVAPTKSDSLKMKRFIELIEILYHSF